jgi:hypothetical protein
MQVRTIPGARPPPWQWQITRRNRLRTLEDVGPDEIAVHIDAIHGLGDLLPGKGQVRVNHKHNTDSAAIDSVLASSKRWHCTPVACEVVYRGRV